MFMNQKNGRFNSRLIHTPGTPDPSTGAIVPPLHMTSTYAQKSPGEHQGFEYSRQANPTRSNLEDTVADLENGNWGLCFASGCSASNTLMSILSSGDHVICGEDLYGGTYRLFEQVFRKYGLDFSYVDTTDAREVEKAFKPETRMVWVETPSNPLLRVSDIQKIHDVINDRESVLFVVDNTFATPYLQKPLDLGADLVLHSLTKYLGGHSDIIGGALTGTSSELQEQLSFHQKTIGGIPGPMDCWLVLRGIKTLHLRMEKHCKNAQKIAEFLENNDRIKTVFYPGLTSHSSHEVASKQMREPGGMISFEIKGEKEDAEQFVSNLQFCTLGESLGGVESLIEHPASMTHASVPKNKREALGITDQLIRLSVGVEDVNDLIEDLEQNLNELS